jgi:hypothetical protein
MNRFGALVAGVFTLALTVGAIQAGAQGSTQVLKFNNAAGHQTAIGFSFSSNAPVAIGSSVAQSVVLQNGAAQFGKSVGATVGHVLIQCVVLAELSSQSYDGICNGIAHVPNGYITFEGNGIFSNSSVNYWAITGGVGPYANDRGEIVVHNHQNGSSSATVTLTP